MGFTFFSKLEIAGEAAQEPEINELSIEEPFEEIEHKIEAIDPVQAYKVEDQWSEEDKVFINWLLSFKNIPKEPFDLNNYTKIIDPNRYMSALIREVEQGPKSPRARYRALQNDIQKLKDYFNTQP